MRPLMNMLPGVRGMLYEMPIRSRRAALSGPALRCAVPPMLELNPNEMSEIITTQVHLASSATHSSSGPPRIFRTISPALHNSLIHGIAARLGAGPAPAECGP